MNTFNNILKSIFPRPFLKGVFLIYNKARISTIDKLLFPEFLISKSDFLHYRTGFPFRENGVSLEGIRDEAVRVRMQFWNDWTQEEFILDLRTPCWIEPEHGWAIVPPNRLVYFSLGISRTEFQKKPGLLKFLRKKEVNSMPRALSLRDAGEENYFHFYNDVLTKIFLLRNHKFDLTEIPIIISKKLWDKPYFQYYLGHANDFRSFNWVVQDCQYIHCQSVLFCKALTHREDLWNALLKPVLQRAFGQKKIFVTRNTSRLRHIENSAEIEAIAMRFGFEIIDADRLAIREQIDIFSNAGFIAGIHGAGLTNLVFGSDRCVVLEIFPPAEQGYLAFHYIMLARMSHFQYQATVGEPGRTKYSGGFYLDPEKWKKLLSGEI